MTSTAATAGLPSGFSVPRWRVIAAIVRRDYLITRSYRLPFVLDAFYGLLELSVYFFISRTFHGFVPAQLQGAPSYFAFAAAGIVVAVVVAAAASGLAQRLREEQLTGTLEALVRMLDRFDFAVLVITPDDVVSIRGDIRQAPRDNVMFELGLFMGRLGPARTFAVCSDSPNLRSCSCSSEARSSPECCSLA